MSRRAQGWLMALGFSAAVYTVIALGAFVLATGLLWR